MTTEDLFSHAQKKPAKNAPKSNVPELSVSELAFSLKKTLEESYGRVRVRGELSGLKLAGSGHLYGDIKDEDAVINIICWRSTLAKLSIKPEDGLDVICIGKVSSYPKSSRYQIIVESMELAGEGALLKMLEERRKKLTAEGLFDQSKKKRLPFLPDIIGVVSSPSGAVIRDIMHRLDARFPRHVLLWPVMVQGDGAAEQITKAINGFNQMQHNRPDLIIVARGGGSLEDLMAFNEENVVRATAGSTIPVISAVGHETDTTLIDYAADIRAPTPTGAAEMAVPERSSLMAQILDNQGRLLNTINRIIIDLRNILEARASKILDPRHILELKQQNFDTVSDKLTRNFERTITSLQSRLSEMVAKIRHPKDRIAEKQHLLHIQTQNLERLGAQILKDPQNRIDQTARMLESLSFKSVLKRGYVVVRDKHGKVVTKAENLNLEESAILEFQDEKHIKIKAITD